MDNPLNIIKSVVGHATDSSAVKLDRWLDIGGSATNSVVHTLSRPLPSGARNFVNAVGDGYERTMDFAGDVPLAPMRGFGYCALKAGDSLIGRGLVDTPLEDRMLTHWLGGSGATLELTGGDWKAVQSSPAVKGIDPKTAPNARDVTLEDGRQGRAVPVDFNSGTQAGVNSLDGSLGRATLYYDSDGTLVGVRDQYDFSNANGAVDMTNLVGSLGNARAYEVRGGVIEKNASAFKDDPYPHQLDSGARTAIYLAGRLWDRFA